MDTQDARSAQAPIPVTTAEPGPTGPGVIALAVLLYLLLADAAIGTFWSGPPLRWWVGGVVAACLAATASVWRWALTLWHRCGWSGREGASALVGLGVLALTVWMPAGTEQGIRAVGLSTPALLCALAALSIVLAALMLSSSPRVPVAGRCKVGLLAVSAVAAFLEGAVGRVPYAQLLHGGEFLGRLPRALQGPFIGAPRLQRRRPGSSEMMKLLEGV